MSRPTPYHQDRDITLEVAPHDASQNGKSPWQTPALIELPLSSTEGGAVVSFPTEDATYRPS